jgi:hypothetical protein
MMFEPAELVSAAGVAAITGAGKQMQITNGTQIRILAIPGNSFGLTFTLRIRIANPILGSKPNNFVDFLMAR